jgi:hypothetical protein
MLPVSTPPGGHLPQSNSGNRLTTAGSGGRNSVASIEIEEEELLELERARQPVNMRRATSTQQVAAPGGALKHVAALRPFRVIAKCLPGMLPLCRQRSPSSLAMCQGGKLCGWGSFTCRQLLTFLPSLSDP